MLFSNMTGGAIFCGVAMEQLEAVYPKFFLKIDESFKIVHYKLFGI